MYDLSVPLPTRDLKEAFSLHKVYTWHKTLLSNTLEDQCQLTLKQMERGQELDLCPLRPENLKNLRLDYQLRKKEEDWDILGMRMTK